MDSRNFVITIAVLLTVSVAVLVYFVVPDVREGTILRLAERALTKTDPQNAERLYDKALKLNPENREALIGKALAIFMRARLSYDNAVVEEFTKLAETLLSKDDSAEAWRLIGLTRSLQQKYDEAIEAYNNALARDPNNPAYLAEQGHVYDLKGDNKKAVELYRRSFEIKPSDFAALQLGLSLVHEKKNKEANVIFEELVRKSEDKYVVAQAADMLGASRLRKGNFAEAESFFKKSLVAWPDYPDALANYGFFFVVMKNYPKAEELFTQALKMEPANIRAWQYLGMLRTFEKKYDEAESAFQKGIAELGNDPTVMSHFAERMATLRYELSKVKALQGATKDALKFLQEAILLNPSLKTVAAQESRFMTVFDNIKNNPEFLKIIK